jgi:hypothetical protein
MPDLIIGMLFVHAVLVASGADYKKRFVLGWFVLGFFLPVVSYVLIKKAKDLSVNSDGKHVLHVTLPKAEVEKNVC